MKILKEATFSKDQIKTLEKVKKELIRVFFLTNSDNRDTRILRDKIIEGLKTLIDNPQ